VLPPQDPRIILSGKSETVYSLRDIQEYGLQPFDDLSISTQLEVNKSKSVIVSRFSIYFCLHRSFMHLASFLKKCKLCVCVCVHVCVCVCVCVLCPGL